ncbi:MAG: substrate-binding domain-containing protein [Myxococcaceae bacterium]|nr:substrate-binding domain-containing protein [Myxococcaceae bacterium]
MSSHPFLLCPPGPNVVETAWVKQLNPAIRPSFVSTISLALAGAARASAGIAVLPRYLGDAEPSLVRIPMPDAPVEPVWLTVHRDLRNTPRIRVLLDFLIRTLREDAALLSGK